MSLHFRIAHWLVVLSFPTLIVTGFALKFSDAWWARPLLAFEGGFAFRGLLHRVAACVLIAAFTYHLLHLLASKRARKILRFAWPGWQDLKDLIAQVRHNLGAKVARPRFGAMSYGEKAEYWAFIWGTLVMAASGFILWFNNLALSYLPKWVSDAATALHYYEALLATFAIAIWHLYMVVFDPDVYPMDRSWLTGRASADHLRHSRPDYYREITGRTEEEA
jgi:formate dehydrogenase gamma subunit